MNEYSVHRAEQEAAAPVSEPERQYYYIEKAKAYLEKMSEAAGRPLTFCVTTFGCQMNARDSEKLTGILERIGYVEEWKSRMRRRRISSSTIHVRSGKMQTSASTAAWGSLAGSKRKIPI